jgi:hypothetical protein
MHEDANASAPVFYAGKRFSKERTFGLQLPRLPELPGLGKREKLECRHWVSVCPRVVKQLHLK